MESIRVAAHSGVVLFNKIPADLILGDLIFWLGGGRSVGRSGGRGRVIVVHRVCSRMRNVGVGIRRGRSSVGAIERRLGRVGHDDRGDGAVDWIAVK